MPDNLFIIEQISQFVEGFVGDPVERGGPAKFGITAVELQTFRKTAQACTADDMRNLTKEEALKVLEDIYVIRPGFDQIESNYLRYVLVDSAVLFGNSRAVKWLQQSIGTIIDGSLGDKTLSALKASNPTICARKILALRLMRIGDSVSKEPSQLRFLAVWLNRTASVLLSEDTHG